MPNGSTVTVDLPPENHHQHHQNHETSKKPESTAPGFFNNAIAKFLLWFLELFVKFIAFIVTLRTLTSIWTPIDNCLDLISEWPWIGSILLITWIFWIPAIGFVWYALGINKADWFWPYFIHNGVFLFINAVIAIIVFFSCSYPSIKEEISNPKFMEVVKDFFGQCISFYLYYIITVCCYGCFLGVPPFREKYFFGKTN